MADNKTSVALEIGAQCVTMAVFLQTKKGVTLSRYGRRDIVLDPIEESMRIEYVSQAIASLVEELKVKGSEISDIVSGQQVVMRFITLPALGMDDLREQVGMEAQQHIPFPMESITYDFHEIGTNAAGERDVLLVAIKRDVLDELNAQVEASGVRTKSVDCSITSLYNTYRASYPDETESVMIVDIGAKTTDILFSDKGRFFTRSVNAAGGFITNAISRERSISYREAEALKISNGVIAMGNGHTDTLSIDDASLATTIRTAMGRVSSEIQRTINYYRSQYKGNAPTRAYICGGCARLPFIVDFLQGVLNIPVEFLNPLENLSIGAHVDEEALQSDSFCLAPVVGVAVTALELNELHIDLVPTTVGKKRAEQALLPKIVTAGLIALAGAGFYAWSAHESLTDAQDKLVKAQAASERVQSVLSRVESTESAYNRAVRDVDQLEQLFMMRNAYADVLLQIVEKSPSVKFWFTEVAPLINYDVEEHELTSGNDVKGTRLVDMAKSRNAQATSAINKPAVEVDSKRRNDAAAVTAIYVTGYTLRDPKNAASGMHREIVRNMINNNFDERSPESLFAYTSAAISANENKYIRFISPSESKGQVPEYLERFMIIMPLKTPISIPELQEK